MALSPQEYRRRDRAFDAMDPAEFLGLSIAATINVLSVINQYNNVNGVHDEVTDLTIPFLEVSPLLISAIRKTPMLQNLEYMLHGTQFQDFLNTAGVPVIVSANVPYLQALFPEYKTHAVMICRRIGRRILTTWKPFDAAAEFSVATYDAHRKSSGQVVSNAPSCSLECHKCTRLTTDVHAKHVCNEGCDVLSPENQRQHVYLCSRCQTPIRCGNLS